MSPFPHFAHLRYAHEPWKSLYTSQRVFTTLLLVPAWVLYYLLMPKSMRPRKSWSIKQIVAVRFTRRVHKVTEMAGVTWGTRKPDYEPPRRSLKETRFEWVEPLPEDLRTGILDDTEVPFIRVGVYRWPKLPLKVGLRRHSSSDMLGDKHDSTTVVVTPSVQSSTSRNGVDVGVTSAQVPLIGIFLHGGGYSHMSAEEKSSTSRIPRRLIKDGKFTEIYSVEYRLLQFAPFPGAVQDAAAVYNLVVNRYGKTSTGGGCKIVLIGDSAGGNLVLSLARWLRDEEHFPRPDGMLLLSPSCDPSHAFPMTVSSYVPRPHKSTDYLVDTPEPRALLQRVFLGHHPVEMIHSPYVSPASERVLRAFYGDETWEEIAKSVGVDINEYAEAHYTRLQAEAVVLNQPSPQITPASSLLTVDKAGKNGLLTPNYCHSKPDIPLLRRISSVNPRHLNLFENFPKACVLIGDAERLEAEVLKLVGAMEHDGVTVKVIGAKDAVHDILMMRWWDERVREEVWRNIDDWVKEFVA